MTNGVEVKESRVSRLGAVPADHAAHGLRGRDRGGAVRHRRPHAARSPHGLALPWVLWAAAFAISEALVVHVQWQREAHTLLHRRPRPGGRPAPGHAARPGDRPGGRLRRHPGRPAPAARAQAGVQRGHVRPRRLAGHHRLRGALRPRRAVGLAGGAVRRPGHHRHRRPLHLRRHQPVRGARPPGAPAGDAGAVAALHPGLGRRRPGRSPGPRPATRRRWPCWRCPRSSSSRPTAPTPAPASSRRTCACCTR